MMIALTLGLLLGAGVDPCSEIDATAPRDPSAAEAYRKVGDAERAAGSLGPAIVAYRAAAEKDPADAVSREELRRLCVARQSDEDPFDLGLRLMDAGDTKRAAVAFRRARSAGAGASAALLEGICLYENERDAEAEPLLKEAQVDPVHKEAALFYRGLIALRRGSGADAGALFSSASADPAFRNLASDLARYARDGSRLVLHLLGETTWDSNVILLPIGTTTSETKRDGAASLSGALTYRLTQGSGPYVRVGGVYHKQFQLDAYDVAGLSAAAGWQVGSASRNLVVEYAYDYRTLGGSAHLSAHRLGATGWLTVAEVALTGTAFGRLESYRSTEYAPFSGQLLGGEAKAIWPSAGAVQLGLAYQLSRDDTDVNYYSWTSHGPSLELSWRAAMALRIRLKASVTLRPYDTTDPAFGLQRSDAFFDGGGSAEYDLGSNWTVRFSVAGRRTTSNIPVFEYGRIAATCGVAYALGI